MAVPPEARASDIAIRDGLVFGPGGIQFGKLFKLGLFNSGVTSLADFIGASGAQFNGIAPSLPRVMRAVSTNEGKLEAINTYDNSFLSFGVYQWTAGAGEGAGELACLLDRLARTAPDTYATYFGKFGLTALPGKIVNGSVPTGRLALDGTILDGPARKEALRSPLWAYRFWRAGHDDVVRKCEVEQAMSRIETFYRIPRQQLGGRGINAFVTSEYGVALVLDQHVNRPGHVPATLVTALSQFHGPTDPKDWDDDDEARLLGLYLVERAKTNMTDSGKRADKVAAAADRGEMSRARGSFAA
jgi:hypothetical protein